MANPFKRWGPVKEAKPETPKITKAMAEVVRRLQNGGIIDHNNRNFVVGTYSNDLKIIRWDVWARLKDSGLIYQEREHWHYVLTPKGKETKV